jgi:arginine deiminase
MIKLSYQEIKERMVEWRNLKKLHAKAREMIEAQNQLIKTQQKQLETYRQLTETQAKTIEDLKLQVEELRSIIFGKKKKKTDKSDDDIDYPAPPRKIASRTDESYQRPIPKDKEVTETENHPIEYCDCGSELTRKQTAIFYDPG